MKCCTQTPGHPSPSLPPSPSCFSLGSGPRGGSARLCHSLWEAVCLQGPVIFPSPPPRPRLSPSRPFLCPSSRNPLPFPPDTQSTFALSLPPSLLLIRQRPPWRVSASVLLIVGGCVLAGAGDLSPPPHLFPPPSAPHPAPPSPFPPDTQPTLSLPTPFPLAAASNSAAPPLASQRVCATHCGRLRASRGW